MACEFRAWAINRGGKTLVCDQEPSNSVSKRYVIGSEQCSVSVTCQCIKCNTVGKVKIIHRKSAGLKKKLTKTKKVVKSS